MRYLVALVEHHSHFVVMPLEGANDLFELITAFQDWGLVKREIRRSPSLHGACSAERMESRSMREWACSGGLSHLMSNLCGS